MENDSNLILNDIYYIINFIKLIPKYKSIVSWINKILTISRININIKYKFFHYETNKRPNRRNKKTAVTK